MEIKPQTIEEMNSLYVTKNNDANKNAEYTIEFLERTQKYDVFLVNLKTKKYEVKIIQTDMGFLDIKQIKPECDKPSYAIIEQLKDKIDFWFTPRKWSLNSPTNEDIPLSNVGRSDYFQS